MVIIVTSTDMCCKEKAEMLYLEEILEVVRGGDKICHVLELGFDGE